MPTLKQITCNVEWSDSSLVLQEYQTVYADGFVETYIAVPSTPTPFSIRLRSNGYIAPGLAMFVYMDGVYQCNRNRRNLKIPDGTTTRTQTEVDFRVRQKEEMMPDGTFNGKQWRFEKLRAVSKSSELRSLNAPHNGEYVGTIEVVVLRCLPAKSSIPNFVKTSTAGIALPLHGPNSKVPKKSISRIVASESSDDDDSSSSESSLPVIGSLYDGACDYVSYRDRSVTFGGDMAWEPSPPKHWRSGSTNTYHGVHEFGAKATGSIPDRGRTRHRTGSNWDQSKQAENQYSNSSIANQFQGGHNSGRSKDRISSSNIPRYSPPGSAEDQVEANSSWERKRDAAPTSPAVVININHQRQNSKKHQIPPTRQLPTTWDDLSVADSSISRKTPYVAERDGDLAERIEKIKAGVWRSENQGNKNNQAQQGGWQSRSGPASNPRSRKSNNGGGNLQGQSAYKESGINGGYSQAESSTTGTPDIPGAWKRSPDEHSKMEDRNAQTQNMNDNWDSNENNHTRDADWNDPVPNWESGENGWGHKTSGNAAGSNMENNQFQGNNQNPTSNPGTWTQQNRHKSKKSRYQGEASSPFEFPKPSKHASKASSSHPSRKQPSPYGGWVNSNVPVQQAPAPDLGYQPVVAPHKSPQDFVLDGGQNMPPPGTNPNAGPSTYFPVNPQFKPYWSSWKQPKESNGGSNTSSPSATSGEPLYKVPLEVAQRKNTSHQVHVSQAATYVHKTSSPVYMDSHEKPYAVFVFKYRSKAILEKILNVKLIESEIEERHRLNGLTKEELVEHLLKTKAKNNSTPQESAASSDTTKSGGSKNTVNVYHPQIPAAVPLNLDAVNRKVSDLQVASNHGSDTHTNPSYQWDRPPQAPQNNKTPSWDKARSSRKNQTPTPSNHETVAGWLDHGSQHGGTSHGGTHWTGNGGSGANSGGNPNTRNTRAGANWNGQANWTGDWQKSGNWGGGNNAAAETRKADGEDTQAAENGGW